MSDTKQPAPMAKPGTPEEFAEKLGREIDWNGSYLGEATAMVERYTAAIREKAIEEAAALLDLYEGDGVSVAKLAAYVRGLKG